MTAFWLRWWDRSENLLLWGNERIHQERQRAEQERLRAEQVEGQLAQAARSLLAQSMTADQVAQLLGLSLAQVESLATGGN